MPLPLLTFIESLATVLLERGIYFYTHERLGFSDTANLALALTFGLAYAAGAAGAHRLCHRLGERTLLAALIAILLSLHLGLGLAPTAAACWVVFPLVGLLSGAKWPVIETYVVAGCTPDRAVRAIGRFNVSWAASVPLALLVTGPLVARFPAGLFLLAAALHAVSLLGLRGLPRRPAHLDLAHPERPDPQRTARYRSLQTSARWGMLGGYAMLFLLAPLLPAVFTGRLGFGVEAATALSAVLDVARVLTFVALGVFTAWRGRRLPLGLGVVGLPLGLGLTLFGPTTAAVLAGEALFGVASGVVYYAALYHAMVLLNADPKAGGAHEALIGLGFALGPLMGLLARPVAGWAGGETAGLVWVLAPAAAITTGLALVPLVRRASP